MPEESASPAIQSSSAKPPEDHRLRMVNRTMQLYRNEAHALIETLQRCRNPSAILKRVS